MPFANAMFQIVMKRSTPLPAELGPARFACKLNIGPSGRDNQ
jgi:hypothetical protein